jgi:hypothetical protein
MMFSLVQTVVNAVLITTALTRQQTESLYAEWQRMTIDSEGTKPLQVKQPNERLTVSTTDKTVAAGPN